MYKSHHAVLLCVLRFFIWALVNARLRTLFTLQFRYRYKPRMTGKEVKLSALKRPS